MSTDILIIKARQLPCHYPADPCDKTDDRGRKAVAGWHPCDECVVRRIAETTKTSDGR